MLVALSIRNIVLIDSVDLEFRGGFCALTGETGAGKSILLSALGLALGDRSEARLIRKGSSSATVSAEFTKDFPDSLTVLLEQKGINHSDGLILRRTLRTDGKSRAFINDAIVSANFLRKCGDILVEIHGQQDGKGLLVQSTHRSFLDSYGGLGHLVNHCRESYDQFSQARIDLNIAEKKIEQVRKEEEYLRHVYSELTALDPQRGEEDELAEERILLRNSHQIFETLKTLESLLCGVDGVEQKLRIGQRTVAGVMDKTGGRLTELSESLDRASLEVDDATDRIAGVLIELTGDPSRLLTVEDKLFSLREIARKHNVKVDELPELKERFEEKLALIDTGETELDRLLGFVKTAEAKFYKAADILTRSRKATAAQLDQAVTAQLPPLALEKAVFETAFKRRLREFWSSDGAEDVYFCVATNLGQEPDALNLVASGGEMSRVMLAIKVVLAEKENMCSLIFDEVDQGIGGATAGKVGERLAQLAATNQVLVVTHSPQIAARADYHLWVGKSEETGKVLTEVRELKDVERREEIARMLAGIEITDEARAAAEVLLSSGLAE